MLLAEQAKAITSTTANTIAFPVLQAAFRGCFKSGEDTMISLTRKLALVAGIGLALASVSYTPPASAQVVVDVVGVAPPPPRFERVPPPRRGWVWAPGYWRWDGYYRRHVWVGGYWMRERVGYRWYPGAWQQAGPSWRWRAGYWGR
jgi:hypothetical protein